MSEKILNSRFVEKRGIVNTLKPTNNGSTVMEIATNYDHQGYLQFPIYLNFFLLTKRCLDIVISLVGMLFFFPLFFILGAIIKLDSNGPILFKQERLGKDRKPYILYKFRSMIEDAEKIKQSIINENEVAGPVFKIKNDPRHTKIGVFMRMCKLDELPQLWNVLKGEMSLVGPRPLERKEMVGHTEWMTSRLRVKQGITGLWQVENKDYRCFDEWIYYDAEYVKYQSLWLDIKIMLKTPLAIIVRVVRRMSEEDCLVPTENVIPVD